MTPQKYDKKRKPNVFSPQNLHFHPIFRLTSPQQRPDASPQSQPANPSGFRQQPRRVLQTTVQSIADNRAGFAHEPHGVLTTASWNATADFVNLLPSHTDLNPFATAHEHLHDRSRTPTHTFSHKHLPPYLHSDNYSNISSTHLPLHVIILFYNGLSR